jgi:hypothetical protein
MSKTVHSVKLVPYDASDLTKLSYSNGDVVYDNTNKTLRVMDGATEGGIPLMRADLANATGGAGVTVSATPPSTTSMGSLWFNTTNGGLYIYYIDTNGGQWIQPVAAPGVVTVAAGYTLPAATISTLGGVIADGTTIGVNSSGVISIIGTPSYANSTFLGSTLVTHYAFNTSVLSGNTSTVTYDWSSVSSVIYESNLTSSYTAAFINVPTVNNRSYVVNIVVNQGTTGYFPNALSINGNSCYINWNNATTPTPGTSCTDTVTFVMIYINSSWVVVGGYSTFIG